MDVAILDVFVLGWHNVHELPEAREYKISHGFLARHESLVVSSADMYNSQE
jgi:hypothetical protein